MHITNCVHLGIVFPIHSYSHEMYNISNKSKFYHRDLRRKKTQNEMKTASQVSLYLLCCLSEPDHGPNRPFGSKRLWWNKGEVRAERERMTSTGSVLSWEGCQERELAASRLASVCTGQWQGRLGSSGIPHSTLQCGALYSNVMPPRSLVLIILHIYRGLEPLEL